MPGWGRNTGPKGRPRSPARPAVDARRRRWCESGTEKTSHTLTGRESKSFKFSGGHLRRSFFSWYSQTCTGHKIYTDTDTEQSGRTRGIKGSWCLRREERREKNISAGLKMGVWWIKQGHAPMPWTGGNLYTPKRWFRALGTRWLPMTQGTRGEELEVLMLQ